MARKKIAFDARYINDRYHGIGRYAFQLLESMVALAPGYDFIIYRSRIPDQRFDWEIISNEQNVSIKYGPEPLYWPHEQFVWPIILRNNAIDLFHSPYFPVPLLASPQVIMTIHDMIFERYPQYMPAIWSRPYYKILMILGLKKAHKIITVSQSTAIDLRKYYKFSDEKLAIIPEGVDLSFSPGQKLNRKEKVLESYGIYTPYILSVGARRPHKNFRRLIQAFSRIRNNYPHNLVFVGPSDPRFPDDITQLINSNGLSSRVKFINWIPEEELPAIYSMADFVVLPSILEGFGLPALEAMACGTPVIAADNSSFPEVIGNAGILVDPFQVDQIEEAMRLLLSDNDKRQQLIQAGLERAVEFSWMKAARMVLDIYMELLA